MCPRVTAIAAWLVFAMTAFDLTRTAKTLAEWALTTTDVTTPCNCHDSIRALASAL